MTAKPDPITTLLATASEIYERKLSPLMVAAYRSALREIPEQQLVSAFNAHLADPRAGAFFPKPADILRHIRGAQLANAERDFERLMQAACFGGHAEVSTEASQIFGEVTGGASTFDMRRWGYPQWDKLRTRFLRVASANGSEPESDTGQIEHDDGYLLERQS